MAQSAGGRKPPSGPPCDGHCTACIDVPRAQLARPGLPPGASTEPRFSPPAYLRVSQRVYQKAQSVLFHS